MHVHAYVHLYPPKHNAGAEMMVHAILRDLAGRGHRVTASTRLNAAWTYDGVEVVADAAEAVREADVVLTHLDLTTSAMQAAALRHRPLVHVVHNHRQLTAHRVRPDNAALVVYNSEWLAAQPQVDAPSMVVYPPVWVADYATPGEGDAVLLANLSQAKGARTFYAVAGSFPERRFVGLRGAYARQVEPPRGLRNVDVRPNTPNIREVYAETGVVLMPSQYESWGRVAIEAACSGIPTIANPTPGLQESLGPGALFVRHGNPRAWVETLKRLEHPEVRAAARTYYLQRARDLEAATRAQLDDLHERLLAL